MKIGDCKWNFMGFAMQKSGFCPSRRHVLSGAVALGGLTLVPFASSPLHAAQADARVFILSDLHSGYERSAATLHALAESVRATPDVPTIIALNGDVFERGNVVALRSGAELDWQFLKALRAIAPVVINLGNHETALVDDMAEIVRQMTALGLTVVSNMLDKRTGRPFAELAVSIASRGRTFRIVGLCTDEMMTYRQPVRPILDLPEPAAWGQAHLPMLLKDADIPVVLSHAGVAADRGFIDMLPAGTLLVGGHEHLTFLHAASDGTRYVHVGAWNRGFATAAITSNAGRRSIDVSLVRLTQRSPVDREMADRVDATMARHLTDADRAVMGRIEVALPLNEAVQVLTRTMARATQAHVGIVNHTTLGTGLSSGPVTAYDLAAFIRFDGPLFVGEIDSEVLAGIYKIANQDGDLPLVERRGDFIHMNVEPIMASRRYKVVTNGWPQLPANQMRYFGREGLVFSEVPEKRLRALFAGQLPS